MQPVGSRETQRMAGAVGRKVSVEDRGTEAEEFQKYSRNLVKNLEAKGIARTALESTNLQLFADHPDPPSYHVGMGRGISGPQLSRPTLYDGLYGNFHTGIGLFT